MHKINWCWLAILMLIFTTPATSQKLLNKIKRGTENSIQKLGGATKKSKVALDFESQPFLPSLALERLMDQMRLSLDGKFFITNLEIYFLPTKTAKGDEPSYQVYRPSDVLVWIDVVDSAGNTIGTLGYEVNPLMTPKSTMQRVTNTGGFDNDIQLAAGDYNLKLFVGGKHCQTIPFSVLKKNNSDVYAAMKELYFLKGPWDNYAYLNWVENVAHRTHDLVFQYFLTSETTKVQDMATAEAQENCIVQIKLKKDGRIIGASPLTASTNTISKGEQPAVRGTWQKRGGYISKYPAFKGSTRSPYITLEEDLPDGTYEIELWIKQATGKEETK
ncbi:MAG: hypothetical protein AAGI49_07710, partial [Bacteroidota bacterium]